MPDFISLEPALVPSAKPIFLIDWELTMRCNLDCSYCGSGTYRGHDNSTAHPKLEQCLQTIDFMYAYADRYISNKPAWSRAAVLNIYGGESLFHPDIETVLQEVRSRHVQPWPLTVTMTTNLIVGKNLLGRIAPHIDEFTASYHSEATDKQRQMFRDNIIYLRSLGKRAKVVLVMHPAHWQDQIEMIAWLENNRIPHIAKQIDMDMTDSPFIYSREQAEWFSNRYGKQVTEGELTDQGRACCGGRTLCTNGDYRNRQKYVLGNNFSGWHCSVNHFFVYIKQLTGEVFVNKDCKMRFDGTVGPIGHLSDADSLISSIDTQSSMICAKKVCWCGLCAPKAEDKTAFDQIMPKYTNAWTASGS